MSKLSGYVLRFESCSLSNLLCQNWEYHQGQRFSTAFDSTAPCAAKFDSEWWFNSCFRVNLNGKYVSLDSNGTDDEVDFLSGIHWHLFNGYSTSLKSTVMKIRLSAAKDYLLQTLS